MDLRLVYVFGACNEDYVELAYSGLRDCERVSMIPRNGRIFQAVKLAHCSRRLSRLGELPGQQVWASHDIGKLDAGGDDEPPVILFIESVEARSPGYVRFVRGWFPNALMCLSILNPMDWKGMRDWVPKVERYFDLVLSCSRRDAEQYGWEYWPDCYTPALVDDGEAPQRDICFIGRDKGRLDLLLSLRKEAWRLGMTADIVVVGRGPGRHIEGIEVRHKPLSYKDCLRRTLNAKCILEITAQESPHCTLRTMEAISYGRLLATTNRDVTNEPFYDKGQILTVNGASDLRRLKPMLVQWTPESFAGRDYFSPARLVARLRGLRAVA